MRKRDRFKQLAPSFAAGFFLALLGLWVMFMVLDTIDRLSRGLA